MNPYVQEWIWAYSNAKGVAKYVLLAIGRRIEPTKRGFETDPLPLEEITKDTGLADSTVREHIRVLSGPTGELEVVKAVRRGEVHRYKLRRELQLPLVDMAPARVRCRLTAVKAPESGDDLAELSPPIGCGDVAGSRRREPAVTAPNGGGATQRATTFLEVVRTEVPTTTEEEAAVANFLAWFAAAYRTHRGVTYRATAKPDAVTKAAVELLRVYGRERLEAMSVAMWADRAEPWLNDSTRPNDRSIFSLRTKAAYLEQLVVGDLRLKPDLNGHVPPCRTWSECRDKLLAEARAQRDQEREGGRRLDGQGA